MGSFQNPRILGHCGQRFSLPIHGHYHLLQFLATGNANYGGIYEL